MHLDLVTGWGRTPSGLGASPGFFSGTVTRPDVLAAAILAVADVAATTYADRTRTAASLLGQDPVLTAGGDRLRFESFSICNGVHARFDLLPDGHVGSVGFGTTNVDINRPLRAALAGVARSDPLHLAVGSEGLHVSTQTEDHQEPPVDLPDRWVRGLAEVPLLLHDAIPVATLHGAEAARFLRSLPRALPGPSLHLSPSPRGLRPSLHTGPGSITLAGAGRLAAAARLAHHASRLDIWAGPTGCSAWSLEVPGGRLLLFLTPSPWRGFSGEGSLLRLLARDNSPFHGRRLLRWMAWEPVIDRTALARASGLDSDQIDAGLAWLAASGRAGYDLAENEWFHRELPLDAENVLRARHPRLAGAARLVGSGAITQVATTPPAWRVATSDRTYDVILDATDDYRHRCTCRWMTEHGHTRGPCKHILAVLLDPS
jgi:hypothetical protein